VYGQKPVGSSSCNQRSALLLGMSGTRLHYRMLVGYSKAPVDLNADEGYSDAGDSGPMLNELLSCVLGAVEMMSPAWQTCRVLDTAGYAFPVQTRG